MLHLAQVSFFKPVIDRLVAAGYSINSIFRSSDLSNYDLDDISNYVPMASLCSFLENTARRIGSIGLLEQFGDLMTLDKIPDFTNLIIGTPDLLTTCKKAANNNDIVFTNETAVFHIDGGYTTWGSRFYDNSPAGHIHIEALNLALIINAFRELIGPGWNPIRINLQQKAITGIESLLTDGHKTRVYAGQPYTAVTFSTKLLAKLPAYRGQLAGQHQPESHRGTNLTIKIDQLLNANRQELIPNLEYFADLAGMSARTLQRKLVDEQTTFSTIIDQWRFKQAIRLLADPNVRVNDIYRKVGYSDVSNFERAFRRWTNTTPGRFRDTLPS